MVELTVERHVLEANERQADQNRAVFDEAGLFVINLMSSPGAGKTSLLETTIERLRDRINIGVIEGDIQSARDAERVAQKGVQAVQIETDGACHLDGVMIREAAQAFDLAGLDLLVVENVGNLVCPAEFNLGEDMKVMILSVAEGDDKPMKYPLMFQLSKVLLVNKIDLLPYLDCDVEKIKSEARQLNPEQTIFEISCRTGQGLDAWCDWLVEQVDAKKKNV
jgi:hydrogenase nickel incorporation protein HypB